jgi:dihydrofolate reductase
MVQESEVMLIAAIGKNRELGIGNELIWRLSNDLKRFKEVTSGSPIIMGRKTFESIGRPLPGRTNIVVTRNHAYQKEGCVVARSMEEAFALARETGAEKIFVIGGGEIYRAALPFADMLDLTLVDAEEPAANVFFPDFGNEFERVSESETKEEDGIRYTWATFKKS